MSRNNLKRMKSRKDEPGQLHSRKEENIQLHDEADLVNFRADAYARFTSNQDYMENVTLKPFHTSRITPSPSFPVHTKQKYPDNATDQDVDKALKELSPEEIYIGDLRLMRAKERALDGELASLKKELSGLSSDSVFSEESRFQSEATDRLAKLHAQCDSLESIEKLEKVMGEVLAQFEEKFSKVHVLENQPYKKHAVPIEKLAPNLEVRVAPALYNPRLIMSFIDMNGEDQGLMLDTDKLDIPFGGTDDFMMVGNGKQNHRQMNYGNDALYGGGMMMGPGNSAQTNGRMGGMNMAPGYNGGAEKARPQESNDDVNMDELNQFLADSNNNDGMDDMDALMNFDQDNENGDDLMNEDAFNVDFLLMDNEMGNQ